MEQNREEIRKEAREILERFAKTLDKVKGLKIKDSDEGKDFSGELSGVRIEGKGEVCGEDGDFRKRMFDNAPKKNGDCILAERASW